MAIDALQQGQTVTQWYPLTGQGATGEICVGLLALDFSPAHFRTEQAAVQGYQMPPPPPGGYKVQPPPPVHHGSSMQTAMPPPPQQYNQPAIVQGQPMSGYNSYQQGQRQQYAQPQYGQQQYAQPQYGQQPQHAQPQYAAYGQPPRPQYGQHMVQPGQVQQPRPPPPPPPPPPKPDPQAVQDVMAVLPDKPQQMVEAALARHHNNREAAINELMQPPPSPPAPGPWGQFQGNLYAPIPNGSVQAAVGEPTPPLTGRQKALLVGINYFGTRAELRGCINDVQNMKRLLTQYGFQDTPDTMVTLTDDQTNPLSKPTGANIINAVQW